MKFIAALALIIAICIIAPMAHAGDFYESYRFVAPNNPEACDLEEDGITPILEATYSDGEVAITSWAELAPGEWEDLGTVVCQQISGPAYLCHEDDAIIDFGFAGLDAVATIGGEESVAAFYSQTNRLVIGAHGGYVTCEGEQCAEAAAFFGPDFEFDCGGGYYVNMLEKIPAPI